MYLFLLFSCRLRVSLGALCFDPCHAALLQNAQEAATTFWILIFFTSLAGCAAVWMWSIATTGHAPGPPESREPIRAGGILGQGFVAGSDDDDAGRQDSGILFLALANCAEGLYAV